MPTRTPLQPGARLVAYARDSGGDQQETSVDQQISAYQDYCAKHGYILLHTYADRAKPGSTTVGRKQLEALLAYLNETPRPCDGLLAWKRNRLARDPDDANYFKSGLRRRGYTLIFIADDVPANLGDAEGVFEAFLDWKAKQDLKDISVDVKRGLASIVSRRRTDGTYEGFAPGVPPKCFKREPVVIGRRRNGEEHTVSRWVPDPETWELGKQAWAMRAGGASLEAIHKATRLFRTPASYSTFFSNHIYLGEFKFGDQTYEGFVPALCDRAQWDAVATLRTAAADHQAQRHPRRVTSRFLLSGLIHCPKCDALLRGETSGTNRWRSYVCPGCHNPRYAAGALEKGITDILLDQIFTPAQMQALQDGLHDQDARDANAAAIARKRKQLTAIKRGINHLLDMVEAGTLSGEPARARLAAREKEQNDLTAEIAQLEHQLATVPKPLTPDQLAALAENFRTELLSGDPERSRRVIHAFVTRLVPESKERVKAFIAFPRSFDLASQGDNTSTGGAPTGRAPKDVLLLTLEILPHRRRLPNTQRDADIFFEHYMCNLSLEELSAKYHLSVSRLCQILKRQRA